MSSQPLASAYAGEPSKQRKPARERYEIQSLIASGGMGAVYRARDTLTEEILALKRVNPAALSDRTALESFEREYQILAGLSHPRIIRVFDYGVDSAGPYYTMELLTGADMAEAAPLPYRDACRYLRDIATSLALLHARRLVHRDLSATNVRATEAGHCKLFDFGTLAPVGYSGAVAGTPPFIAPESVHAASIDHRADLFSLGALAYWMLTGRHAFPASRLEDLRPLWRISPAPPSALRQGIPEALDGLVLSLLRMDPRARPTSVAEVIAMLEVIGELPPEEPADAERLAQSFLSNPRFVGRKGPTEELESRLSDALAGRGSAVCIEALSGMGRTRLLEELALRAQVEGAIVLRVDASTHRQPLGVVNALVARLAGSAPESSRARPGPHASLFEEISRDRPLIVEVDDVEHADEASLGVLAAVASGAARAAILLVVTERTRGESIVSPGLRALRGQCTTMTLSGLTADDTLELTRSVFGDAPNAARYSEWMHERTAGSPLHFLEISRRLAATRVARYVGGAWVLPFERPDSASPEALEDALALRLRSLGADARELAECLALLRARRPTVELCRLLADERDRGAILSVLDELERENVLHPDAGGYRFSSLALSEALLRGIADERRARHHLRLGAALSALAPDDPGLAVESGWHLIQGGDELPGAHRIADVAFDNDAVLRLISAQQPLGRSLEAALRVYARHGVSRYRQLPLLSVLSFIAYYEHRRWGETYGEEATAAFEAACGLLVARRVARWLGPAIGLAVGVVYAFLCFAFTPKADRPYPFADLFVRLFGVVTTLAGVSSLSFDHERTARIADVISPFAILPERAAPVGIYRYCLTLRDLTAEAPAAVVSSIDSLLRHFQDPTYYSTIPEGIRQPYIVGLQSMRAVMAILAQDGAAFARCVEAVDESPLGIYRVMGNQLRFVHHTSRGESAVAQTYHERVELHAAQEGSAWQAEVWQGAPMMAAYFYAADVSGMMRLFDQLTELAAAVPTAARYARLAKLALRVLRGDRSARADLLADPDVTLSAPHSFLGWSLAQAVLARAHNQAGDPRAAQAVCERALRGLTDAERSYPGLFLGVEIELAHAEARLGEVDGALRRVDQLVARFDRCNNPLIAGLLYEARALICLTAGRSEGYAEALNRAENSLRPIGAPSLIAKCERLAERGGSSRNRPSRNPPETVNSNQINTIVAASSSETV